MRICLSFFVLTLTATLSAQNIALQEDFSSGVPPTGWVQQNINGASSQGWTSSLAGDFRAQHEDENGGHTCDNRLISAPFHLNGFTQAYLHLDSEINFATYLANHPTTNGDGVSDLEISANGGLSWTTIWTDTSTVNDTYSFDIDMSAFAGQTNLVLGIHYYGSYAHEWWVDNIVINDDPNPPPPAPTTWLVNLPSTFASTPFSMGFETLAGSVPPWMALTSVNAQTQLPDPEGWCNIGQLAPMLKPAYSGIYALEMGLIPGAPSTHYVLNAMVIGLNGGGTIQMQLNAQIINWGEELDSIDGIWVSADGQNWHSLLLGWADFSNSWSALAPLTIDAHDLDLTGDYYLMFAQSDDTSFGADDGIGVDEIMIDGGSYQGPLYVLNNLSAGAVASLECTGCPPNSQVVYGYSFAGPGPTQTPYGLLEMSMPISSFGPFQANDQGERSILVLIPGNISGLLVHTQCVIFSGGSNSLSNGVHQAVQ